MDGNETLSAKKHSKWVDVWHTRDTARQVRGQRTSPERASRGQCMVASRIAAKISAVEQEQVLLAMSERARNARILDWIEQSPQPKLCEQHKAWSSTSSDYDTASSDLSETGTWENFPLSVSMRSAHEAEKKKTEDQESSHPRHLAARARPPSYPQARAAGSTRPPLNARRVLDLQAHDSPTRPNAEKGGILPGAGLQELDSVAGLQELDSASEASRSDTKYPSVGDGRLSLALDTAHLPLKASYTHSRQAWSNPTRELSSGTHDNPPRTDMRENSGASAVRTTLSPTSPHKGRFSAQHGAVPGYLATVAHTNGTHMQRVLDGDRGQPHLAAPSAAMNEELWAQQHNSSATRHVSACVSPRPTQVPPPPSIKHSSDPSICRRVHASPSRTAPIFAQPSPRPVTPSTDIHTVDEEYDDVYEFMSRQQPSQMSARPAEGERMSASARVSRAVSSRALSPREAAVKLNLDAFVSSATLKVIEQEWERAKSPLNCPATAGMRCSADAVAAQQHYGGFQETNLPGDIDVATQREATREVSGGGGGGGDDRAGAKVKDPLSMRINMETEMLGSGADSQDQFAFEHDSAFGSDTDSLSPVPTVGCISAWVKVPTPKRSRPDKDRTESLLFRQSGSSWLQGLRALATSTSNFKPAYEGPSSSKSKMSTASTNSYSAGELRASFNEAAAGDRNSGCTHMSSDTGMSTGTGAGTGTGIRHSSGLQPGSTPSTLGAWAPSAPAPGLRNRNDGGVGGCGGGGGGGRLETSHPFRTRPADSHLHGAGEGQQQQLPANLRHVSPRLISPQNVAVKSEFVYVTGQGSTGRMTDKTKITEAARPAVSMWSPSGGIFPAAAIPPYHGYRRFQT